MKVIESFSDSHIVELHGLYQAEWWTSERTLEETKACVDGSQICIGIIDENETLVGFVRVLTDFVFKALIFDVIVSEQARGLKLGHQLMELVCNHPKLKKVKHFELYCLPEMLAFYERYGFSEQVGDIKLMRSVKPN